MLAAAVVATLSAATLIASGVSAVTPLSVPSSSVAGAMLAQCEPPGISNSLLGTTRLLTDICIDGTVAKKPERKTPNADDDVPVADPDGGSTDQSGANCEWYTLDPDQASARWGENSPADGRIEGLKCYPKVLDLTKEGGGGGSALVETRFVPNAGVAVPLPPPPDPAGARGRARVGRRRPRRARGPHSQSARSRGSRRRHR